MEEQTVKTSSRRKATNSMNVCDGGCCGSCGCQGSSWQCHHSSHLARWILGLVIIILVFWCGMKIGELKAELRGVGFGWDDGRFGGMMTRPQRMMIFDSSIDDLTAPATKTDTATASKKK